MLRTVLEAGAFSPLAAGVFYSRNQDRCDQCTGSVISLFELNIHGIFIATLASCSVLTPEQLGWDPSIEVWDGDHVVPSYRAKMQQFALTYHVPWIISAFSSFQISESLH